MSMWIFKCRLSVVSGLLLVLVAAAGSYALAASIRHSRTPTRIEVRATPVRSFDNRDASRVRFGELEFRGGLALTEPDCGTDLQAIRVTARRDGDAYVVNGTKTWISNGIYGSCFALLVKTDPNAEPRHRGGVARHHCLP